MATQAEGNDRLTKEVLAMRKTVAVGKATEDLRTTRLEIAVMLDVQAPRLHKLTAVVQRLQDQMTLEEYMDACFALGALIGAHDRYVAATDAWTKAVSQR